MDISILRGLAKAYKKSGGSNKPLLEIAEEGYRDDSASNMDSDFLSASDLETLLDLAQKNPDLRDSKWKRRMLRTLKAVLHLKTGAGKRITSLEVMTEALREHLQPLPNHWLFMEGEIDKQLLPWFVQDLEYHPAQQSRDGYRPAFISVQLRAKCRGKGTEKTLHFRREDLGDNGCRPPELLSRRGLLEETDELRENYQEELDLYYKLIRMKGDQFWAVGRGRLGINDEDSNSNRWWREGKSLNFERDGGPSRVIMDDEVEFGDKHGNNESVYCDTSFWQRGKDILEKEENQDTAAPIPAPIHPIMAVFSLLNHEFAEVHVSNLSIYEYQPELADKLVLPPDTRGLIDVLIGTTTKNSEDLVRGKKGGAVILCSGSPGTGKTLTAEVYAEVAGRPLYTVQCSQLGVDPEELEKSLGRVLRRSVRWNAITLIDEADVYIHERGTNVQQNAIVGVFLRLLEYYSGVLFLTTNRETVVDDAIRSRCMAHVRYGVPKNREDKVRLWTILSTQYKVPLSPNCINRLIELFPQVSGRTIKQFCRLAQAMSETRNVDPDLFLWLSKFQDVETPDEALAAH